MPRDGTGQYNLPTPAVVTGTAISAADENLTRADLAAALTGSLARDGSGGMTGPLTLAGNAAAALHAVSAAQALGSLQWVPGAGGTAQAQTIAPSPAIGAYVDGQVFRFLPVAPNTGVDPTLAVSGLAARPIKAIGGGLLWPGALRGVVEVMALGGEFRLLSPVAGLSVDASGGAFAATGTPTALTLGNPGSADEIGAWAAGAPTRLTMLAPGRVSIVGSITYGSSAASARLVQLRQNGVIIGSQVIPSTPAPVTLSAAAVATVAAGDFLEVTALQDSGLTMSATGTVSVTVLR